MVFEFLICVMQILGLVLTCCWLLLCWFSADATHEFATSYSPETDTPEDFVRECRDFVVATFRVPVDAIRSGQLVQQVKEAIARLRQQKPAELSRVQSRDSQSPVPSEVQGDILSPQSNRTRTSSSPALSPDWEDRRDNVFFPQETPLQPTNLNVHNLETISAAAMAELDKSSEFERGSESERMSDLELDAAAEEFLKALEQEFETRKREIEETHRRHAERLEQRQKVSGGLPRSHCRCLANQTSDSVRFSAVPPNRRLRMSTSGKLPRSSRSKLIYSGKLKACKSNKRSDLLSWIEVYTTPATRSTW